MSVVWQSLPEQMANCRSKHTCCCFEFVVLQGLLRKLDQSKAVPQATCSIVTDVRQGMLLSAAVSYTDHQICLCLADLAYG